MYRLSRPEILGVRLTRIDPTLEDALARRKFDVSLWQRWWRQPQRVWLRRAMFQVHLWCGLILGLYIVLLSITGSVLVYRIELDRWVATPTPAYDPDRPLVEKAIVATAAMHEYPGWT